MTDPQPIELPEICLQRVSSLLASGKRKLLGIVAPPGAGKSTLVQALAGHFSQAVQVVPMDGFHLANSELERLGRRARKGAPDTFDAAGYVNLLHRIKTQSGSETIYAPDFRREIEEAIAGVIPIHVSTPLLITEGNYLLLEDPPWAQVRALADEIWYLDVPEALRHERLLARHIQFGRSPAQALAWIAATDEPNAQRIARTRQHANFCLTWA